MSAFSDPENNFMHTKKQSCWSTILLPVVNCFYLFMISGVDCVSDDHGGENTGFVSKCLK